MSRQAEAVRRSVVDRLAAQAHTFPTDQPEQDGTLSWDATTIVICEASADGQTGIGYTYSDPACAELIRETLAPLVREADAMSPQAAWWRMIDQTRNLGRRGLVSAGIAAVDGALWDLKARLLGLPLVTLLGQVHEAAPLYGSGGFTSYSDERLAEQLRGWIAEGMGAVKIKIGRDRARDLERIQLARTVIGSEIDLYVDANGAYGRSEALSLAEQAAPCGVCWFEEPVSSDDLDGMRMVRERAPAGMAVAAGEYSSDLFDARRMIDARAVDVVQADATRCGGITGFLAVSALCQAACLRLSAHTAPALHLHPCCAVGPLHSIEYFHDHVRIERMVFDGVVEPVAGRLVPRLDCAGNGLALRSRPG